MNAWAAAHIWSNGEWLRGWRMKRRQGGCFGRRARMRFAKLPLADLQAIHAALMRVSTPALGSPRCWRCTMFREGLLLGT